MWATPLFNKKSALAPLHSDACAAAIFRNELDAGFLQGPLNSFSDIFRHRGALSVIPFETLDRRQRARRRFRQLSDDDTETRPWHYFLIETLIAVLPGMAVQS
jgi:hypothetical protein